MSKRYSIAEARENFTTMVNEAEKGERVELTRRGQPVAVLMSLAEYGQLAEGKRSFWESYQDYLRRHPPADPSGIDIGDAFEGVRDPSPGRDFSW
ncbi:MAG TPA: type II toxin-antitoxin system Phd/YefM family antitoxin [Thermoanaerobaculia bacterium]|nr:type II toxin-antitoxin system Phd/YefM family antitoxin [Thermoanaerobaculia bacterium]